MLARSISLLSVASNREKMLCIGKMFHCRVAMWKTHFPHFVYVGVRMDECVGSSKIKNLCSGMYQ